MKEIEEERQKFYDKMKKMNTDLKQIEEELAKLAEVPMNVVYAFITFDKSSDREKVLDAYSKVCVFPYLPSFPCYYLYHTLLFSLPLCVND